MNLLDISDNSAQHEPIPSDDAAQHELIPSLNGDVEQLIDAESNNKGDQGGSWNENWLLGPNHEQSIPQNTEPGGDIDLLLMND